MRYSTIMFGGALTLASYGAIAQDLPPNRVYMLHSGPAGQCPALVWNIGVNDVQHSLSGVITWGDNMQHVARAAGTFELVNKTFQMQAKEVGGEGRTADITGKVLNDGALVANISGPVTCNGVQIPWFRPNTGRNQ
jgi:hypothetical protein